MILQYLLDTAMAVGPHQTSLLDGVFDVADNVDVHDVHVENRT